MSIKITTRSSPDSTDDRDCPLRLWNFPAHEVGVRLEQICPTAFYTIEMRMPDANDLFAFANISDALRRGGVSYTHVKVIMPYVPYGRQDRVTQPGEAFGLSVFGRFFDSVAHCGELVIVDPHSLVTNKVLTSGKYTLTVIPQATAFVDHMTKMGVLTGIDALVAPDAGAATKVHSVAAAIEDATGARPRVVTLNKTRRVVTLNDNITFGVVEYQSPPTEVVPLTGRVVVVDDICDGGATFRSLERVIRELWPDISDLSLYVTHGIFSNSDQCQELIERFDHIYTPYFYSQFDSGLINR